MKKILILLMLSPLFLCCNSDDDPPTPIENASLNNSWNMDSYVAFMENLPVLEDGDITWTFNGNNLTIVNTVEQEYPYMITSGTYSLTMEDGLITFEEGGSYHYEIEGNQLTLEHVEAEVDAGPIMTFIKN